MYRPEDRHGSGVLIVSISTLLAVLSVSMATASFRSELAAEVQNAAIGRRALEVCRSSLAEAALDFQVEANREGSPWYRELRAHLTSARGMESWISSDFKPAATLAMISGEDLQVAPVRVSAWRDFPVAREAGTFDEKFALVTLTSDVSARPDGAGPFRGRVRRQLQRSYHVKQTRIVSPAPFGGWTLYVNTVPQLSTEKDAYDRLLRTLTSRRESVERAYRTEIDQIIAALHGYLAYMVRKAADWDRAREEIAKTQDALDQVIALTPSAMGLTLPAVAGLETTIRDMKEKLKRDIATNLAAFHLPDEATFRGVAAHPYPPENLTADIGFQLTHGTWPSFRGFRAAPEGLVEPGADLDNPVVVERERVNSREIDFTLPPPPVLPRRPTYSLRTQDIAWLDRYGPITSEFRRYMSEHDRDLDLFTEAYAHEFARHEDLFHLLAARPVEFSRNLMNLGYQSSRASWFFADQDAFLRHVVGADGVARLSGVYAVKGDLTRFPALFEGRGYVAVEGRLELAGLSRRGASSTAVFFAGQDATAGGPCDAAILAPAGRLKSITLENTLGHAVVGAIAREDDFTVVRRRELGDSTASGIWINVAPVALAEALLRE